MTQITNLGKLLFLIISFIFSINSFALLQVSVDKSSFYPGDVINFTISVSGKNIVFPNISNIKNNAIISNSSSQAISIVNGNMTKKINKSYGFQPKESLTIPSYEVVIDGKKQQTKPLKLIKLKPVQNQTGDNFILSIKADKNTAFIGEKIDLTITFKQKKSVAVKQVNINQVVADGLWLTTDNKFSKSENNLYIINQLHYQATPQAAGLISIKPIIANVTINDNNNNNFFIFSKLATKKVYSNPLTLNIKPLSGNLTIFGNYKISAKVDKTKIKANQPVNFTLQISGTGTGNIIDIEKFNISIDNTTIYTDEPLIDNNIFTQKFAIIANSDFIIPQISFNYFDKETKQEKIIKTKQIKIQVASENLISSLKNTTTGLIKPQNIITKKINNKLKYYYLLLGIIIGISLMFLFFWLNSKKNKKNDDLLKSIKRAKNDRQLFDLLLPLNNPNLTNILQQLEANIYQQQKHKINKKELIKKL